MSTDLWTGIFGLLYTTRTQDAGKRRWPFWRDLQQRYPATSALEVGCGAGHNLRWLTCPAIAGVDVNESALAIARHACRRARLVVAPARRLPFADGSYQLVFSAGLLIHIPSVDLPKVMDEMWRTTSKYLLVIEYEAAHETMVEYRGKMNELWKRPYRWLFEDRYALEHLESGFLAKPVFDDCTYHLWRKA